MIRQGMTCAASVAVLALISARGAADVGPLPRADIYVLGEVHDNADTHAMQAGIIRKVSPRALVFEMLTPAQAEAAKAVDRSDAQAVAEATQWAPLMR
jgi:uncharacterized iron-regulated protein